MEPSNIYRIQMGLKKIAMKMRVHWEEVNSRRLRVCRSLGDITKPVISMKVMRLTITLLKILKRVIHLSATAAE